MKYTHYSIIIFLFSFIFYPIQSNPFDNRQDESRSFPKFIQRDITSDTGYFTIEWNPNSTPIVLYSIHNKKIQIIYSGNDHLTTLSGLKSGNYDLVLCPFEEDKDSNNINLSELDLQTIKSNPDTKNCDRIQAKVQHHSDFKTILFFGTGAFLFLSILSFLFYSLRFQDKENS
ncbi:hypothetical protein [Leptospira sp. GIMC2001]|uniref:hypothetical protein n=1 Tax=Leptospira sp. GIMC2001 TaxID=1513297 RepID=UPI002349470A|nr:hypothetical protein [Leptospira sp. GIMC2001]WCL50840.1 hypothetical protein O4O04_08515 [Leptospira sp. GIMC2001]